ncbi:MAG: response regulator [Calditrichaeota bacterium]|nr:response regulator [Calditrichota bacterium]MCB0271239.1 response regulator [Calditrichota bacterium]MCB0298418.1 response regulator [Calditrichota bacterium]MCB9067537.1 response regulator [Calditrichia bacterium]
MSQQNDQSGMSRKDEEMVNELFQSDDGQIRGKIKLSDFLILIVDDQLINRQILSRGLSDLGYKTAEAENGLVALAKMKRTKPDVVLMDIDMPELNGLETTRRIRTVPEWQDTKVLMVTANDSVKKLKQALSCRVDDYIVKPIKITDIDRRIRQHLNLNNAT